MYAVIKTGGKQYRVQQGDVIFIEKLDSQAGDTVTFDEVLLVSGDDATTIEDVYEPYLIQLGFIARTPRGRVVMPLGYRHMGYAPPADVGQQKMNF